MKKLMKTVLSIAFSLAVLLSVSAIAAAAGSDPEIRLSSGAAVDRIQTGTNGRLFAPYDTLFEALGADASYDPASGAITAARDGITAVFALGEETMKVSAGGGEQTVYIDAAPYQGSATGLIYVPVRYAAQALGFTVGWSESDKSVVLESIDDLIAQSGAAYTVMDRVLAYQSAFTEKKHAVSGSIGLNLNMPGAGGASAVPLKMSGTFSGLAYKSDAEMTMNLKTNTSAFTTGLNTGSTLDAGTLLFLSLLDNLDLKIIQNSQTGMLYVQSPLVASLTGYGAGVWMSADLNSLNAGLPKDVLGGVLTTAASFKDYLASTLKGICLLDDGMSASDVRETLDALNGIFSDKALVRQGDNYMATLSPGSLGLDPKELDGSMKLTLKFIGETYTGTAVDASFTLAGTGSFTLSSSVDAGGSGSLSLQLNLLSALTMDMNASFTYTDTNQAPAAAPPPGSTVVAMDNIVSAGLIG